jgi:hypothetical protein
VQQSCSSMSRFKADIKALESQLRRQQRLLQELQQENEQYKHKESALLSTLITMQCRMSALASEGGNQSSREHSLHSVHSGSLSGATGVSEGSRDTSGLCRPDQALCAAPDSSPGHSSGQHYTAAAASPEAAQHLHQHTHQHIHQHAAAVGSCSAQSDSVCPPSLPSAAAAAAAEGGMSAQQAQLESQRSTAERSALDLARMQQQLQALDQLLQVDMQEVRYPVGGGGGGGAAVGHTWFVGWWWWWGRGWWWVAVAGVVVTGGGGHPQYDSFL